jgi:hypothetical protein
MEFHFSTDILPFSFLLFSLVYIGGRLYRRALVHISRENALLVGFCGACAWAVGLQTVLGIPGWLQTGPLVIVQLLALIVFFIFDTFLYSPGESGVPPSFINRASPSKTLDRFFYGILFFVLLTLLYRMPLQPPHRTDSLSYHLPFVAGWMETGRLGHIPGYLQDGGEQGYPLGHELLVHWVMAPIESDLPAMLPGVLALVFLAIGVAAAADNLGAPRWAGRLGALVLSTSYFADWMALTLHVDLVYACFWTAAFSLGLAFFKRPDCRWRLMGFSLAFGLAASVKTTHVAYGAVLLVALWFLSPEKKWLKIFQPKNLIPFFCILILLSGFWYGRNLVRFGNPFYPVSPGLLGKTVAGQAQGYGLEHSDSLWTHINNPVMWRLWAGAIGWRAGVWLWGLLAVFLAAPLLKISKSLFAEHKQREAVSTPTVSVLILVSIAAFLLYFMTPWQYRTDIGEYRRFYFLAQALRYGLPWLVTGMLLWCVLVRNKVFAGWLLLCAAGAAVQSLWRTPWGALFVLAGAVAVTVLPEWPSRKFGNRLRKGYMPAAAGVVLGLVLICFSPVVLDIREKEKNKIYWRLLEGRPGESQILSQLNQMPSGSRVYFLGCNVPYVFMGDRLQHELLDASRRDESLTIENADWEEINSLAPDVLVLRKGQTVEWLLPLEYKMLFETKAFLVLRQAEEKGDL